MSRGKLPDHWWCRAGALRALALACCALAATGAAVCVPVAVAEAGERLEEHVLRHAGLDRRYALYAPAVPDGARAPLVVVLHGGGGNGENAAYMTGFTEKARQEKFFVAYPDGTGRRRSPLLTWNAWHCCGHAMKNRIDDVGFLRAMIDRLVRERPIDPRRVYVTGMSNGGMLTHRAGIELAGTVAAIAPVVAALFGDEPRPAGPVPVLIINGALDAAVPPAGGPPGGRATAAWDGTPVRPAAHQAQFWAAANGCEPEPRRTATGRGEALIEIWRYTCPGGRDVVRYLVGDNGHAWPGGRKGSRRGDPPGRSVNATDVIWDFFKAYSRPAD
jgi:polyhydroxybutyrate depolymerase